MAIKKLQNNFTTPAQSKRLLELGVPADSADCYFFDWKARFERNIQRDLLPYDVSYDEWIIQPDSYGEVHTKRYLPCWSVGRLIEIYEKCVGERFERHIDPTTLLLKPILEDVLSQIDEHTKMVYRHLDLSKLEE